MRSLSFVAAWLLTVLLVCVSSPVARAALTPGSFGAGQAWTPGVGVATDGTSLFIGGLTYPVPTALTPTTPFTFAVSAPTPSTLYATELDASCGGANDVRAFYFDVIPDTATAGHLAAITQFCVPNGIAFDGYALGQQSVAFVAGRSQPSDATQTLFWVDLTSGGSGSSALSRDLDDVGFPEFAPSATVALTREVAAASTTATYHLVDLCPATFGTILNPAGGALADLPAPDPTAQVLVVGGHPVARVSHPSLAGGSVDVALTDCLATGTTTTSTSSTTSTFASTTTSSTTTTLPPTVTTTDLYAPGGLLEVLDRVNAGQPGPITFALPGPGPYVIDLGGGFANVAIPVTIDGTSQQSPQATPLVEIRNGTLQIAAPGCTVRGLAIDGGITITPPADGTRIEDDYVGIATDGVTETVAGGYVGIAVGTSNNTIQHDVIEGFVRIGADAPAARHNIVRGNRIGTNAAASAVMTALSGVEIVADDAVVGGMNPGDPNVVVGRIEIDSAEGAVVAGNLLGTDVAGTKLLGLGDVVIVRGSRNVIGPANVVTGKIFIQGGSANTVAGNLIGTDATGMHVLGAAGGAYPGIELLESSDNLIGGTSAADRNVIAGHASAVTGLVTDAILILGQVDAPSARNRVRGNFIGTDVGGMNPLPNDTGIDVADGTEDNEIGGTEPGAGNVVAFNRSFGVRIAGGHGTTVAGNSIDRNAGGIYVAAGANDDVTAPVLTGYTGGATSRFVGHAAGASGAMLTIEFFANPAGDGQGRTFCARRTYAANAGGTVTFDETFTCPVSAAADALAGTVTATDAGGNTSEFSAPAGVTTPGTTTTTLPADPLAAVRAALSELAATLTAPPQPDCTARCRCASLPTASEHVATLVDAAASAVRPKACTRSLAKAEHVARGFQKHVASLAKRHCLAPESRGSALAQEAGQLLNGLGGVRKSHYCVTRRSD
jgi:hypothetical protein